MGEIATSPLHSWGSPTKGTKSKRAQNRAEMLHHRCILGSRQQRGQNQSMPKRGRKCYITPAFSGVPNKGDKIKAGQKEGGNATSPLHSTGSPTKGTKSSRPERGRKCYIIPEFLGVPNKGDKIKAGPKVGGNATSPLHSRGSPTKGAKSKGGQKRAEMLHHACILGGPQQRGENQSGSKSGRKCYINAAFLGVPNKGDKIKAGPKVGGNATLPLNSRGSRRKGTKLKWSQGGRKCYIIPEFLGIPNKGDKIKPGPKEAGNVTSPLHSRGSPIKGTK